MNRQTKIADKLSAVKVELEKWLAQNTALEDGEKIIVEVSTQRSLAKIEVSTPVSAGNSMLNMKIRDFFTISRLKSLGISPKLYLTRIRSLQGRTRMNERDDPTAFKLTSVRDLVSVGEELKGQWKNCGNATVYMIKQVLEASGIPFPKHVP